jgi:hypothetical protein
LAKPSVTTPFSQALSRTGKVLFKPFQFPKWFILGFCVFLAHLGEGGGGGLNIPSPAGGGTGGGGGGGPGGGPGGRRSSGSELSRLA